MRIIKILRSSLQATKRQVITFLHVDYCTNRAFIRTYKLLHALYMWYCFADSVSTLSYVSLKPIFLPSVSDSRFSFSRRPKRSRDYDLSLLFISTLRSARNALPSERLGETQTCTCFSGRLIAVIVPHIISPFKECNVCRVLSLIYFKWSNLIWKLQVKLVYMHIKLFIVTFLPSVCGN